MCGFYVYIFDVITQVLLIRYLCREMAINVLFCSAFYQITVNTNSNSNSNVTNSNAINN